MEINMRIYNKCPDFQRGRTKDIGDFFLFSRRTSDIIKGENVGGPSDFMDDGTV